MLKTAFAAVALTAAALIPVMAGAGGLKMPPMGAMTSKVIEARSAKQAPNVMPPSGFQGQWWTHPAGCQYSRAGRPGEVVWFLTSVPKGASCPEFIQQKATDHVYRAPRMIDG